MAEYLPAPTFPDVKYTAGTMDIGSGYARGIETAGKALSSAAAGVMDIMNRRNNANDMLKAMHQTGMMTDDQYKAIAGKSLGAQESMLGMYAGQWIQQQAAERELQKIGFTGQTQVTTAHQQLLDQIAEYQRLGLYPPGTSTSKVLVGGQQPGQPAPTATTMPLIGPRGALPLPKAVTPAMTQQATAVAGTPGAPQPLGSGNIYAPGPKLGTPIASSATMPPGSTIVQGTSPQGQTQHFVKLPDGTLQPIQG